MEIWDVYPKNVLTDKDGNLYFIDVNVDPARDRYKKYKIPGDLQMEIRPTAKDFYKDGYLKPKNTLNR